jgi:uncharacterized protein with PIN domain
MRFVCDAMLGRLAKYLRILGLDTVYARTAKDVDGYLTNGIPSHLLTKRQGSTGGEHWTIVRANDPRDQLREVAPLITPYLAPRGILTRCILCNTSLAEIQKKDAERFVPEFVFHQHEKFTRCPACGRIYWEGTHSARMAELINEILPGDR